MKTIQKISLALILFVVTPTIHGDFLKHLVKTTDSKQKFFVGLIEDKQKLLKELTKEQAELANINQTVTEKTTRNIEITKTLLANVERELQKIMKIIS